MIELSLRFVRPIELSVFISVFILSVLLTYLFLKDSRRVSLVPLIILNLALLALWMSPGRVYHDESAHLHFSWLVSQGAVPYKDFWQHHSPLLWVLLSPFVRLFQSTPLIFKLCHMLSFAVFMLNAYLGWKIARKVWGDKADAAVYLLIITSYSVIAHVLVLRPDIFMALLMLLLVYFCLEIPSGRKMPCFCAGVVFAFSVSLILKQYLLFLLPVYAIFLIPLPEKGRIRGLAAYSFGLFAGVLPLAGYLLANGIVKEYFTWVFGFNKQIVVFSVFFPLAAVLMGGWGVFLLRARSRQSTDTSVKLALGAFLLSTLSSFTTTSNINGGYYLIFWIFICALIASGCPLADFLTAGRSRVKGALLSGVFFALISSTNAARVIEGAMPNAKVPPDSGVIAELLRYCSADSCVAYLPLHPLFARDASRLYTSYQYIFSSRYPMVKNDLLNSKLAEDIISSRPALVACEFNKLDFTVELQRRKLITKDERSKLLAFFKKNYTRRAIYKEDFYIRNDKVHK